MNRRRRWARGIVLAVGLLWAGLALLRWTSRDQPPATGTTGGEALAAQLEVERDAWRQREAVLTERETELTAHVTALEGSLANEQELRFAREREWLEFTQLVGSLQLEAKPPIPEFLTPTAATTLEEAARTEAEAAAARAQDAEAQRLAAATLALDVRGEALRASLRALLTAEQVQTLEFIELGRPHTFEGRGVVGPVFARIVDDRGHYIGGLFAQRLWVEVSRAARCVTLVLEDGYEIRGGVRQAFGVDSRVRQTPASGEASVLTEGAAPSAEQASGAGAAPVGVHRIFLESVDPVPWLEALREIIDQAPGVALPDDGVYDLVALRLELNELLRKAGTAVGEGWRLRALGGVQSGVLRDVQLVEHAADGTVVRRLFADRLAVHRIGRGIELVLEAGSQERNGRLAPFLEGRYRVSLPHARADEWVAAGVPGAGRTR